MSTRPDLLVAVHPTRGLDVGATEAVHKLLLEQREEGAAILLISEDLDELLAISDRIAVIFDGEIVGEMWWFLVEDFGGVLRAVRGVQEQGLFEGDGAWIRVRSVRFTRVCFWRSLAAIGSLIFLRLFYASVPLPGDAARAFSLKAKILAGRRMCKFLGVDWGLSRVNIRIVGKR